MDIKKKEDLKKISNCERLIELEKVKSIFKIQGESINENELKELAENRNITIGSHTYSHPILTKCDDKTLDFEIKEAKSLLEQKINCEVKYFAYPNGSFSTKEKKKVIEAGFNAAFTTQPNYIDQFSTIDLFEIPRFEVIDRASYEENICRATGVWYMLNLSKRDNA